MIEKLLLLSFSTPGQFGPYTRQLELIIDHIPAIDCVWVCLHCPTSYNKRLSPKRSFLGSGFAKRNVVVSELNENLKRYTPKLIDFISGDVQRFEFDQPFITHSICWFPNHFETKPHHALTGFDAVAVLNPSSVPQLMKQTSITHVTHVPHIIEEPNEKISRQTLNFKKDEFIVGMVFANYGEYNRKSIDIGLLTFKEFLSTLPPNKTARMFIRAVHLEELKNSGGSR